MSIRIGCCIPGASFMPEAKDKEKISPYSSIVWGAEQIIAAGYDYSESSIGLLNSVNDEEFEHLLAEKDKYNISICNCFIPAEFSIYNYNDKSLWEYVEKAMSRMNSLGTKLVVFGSGGARRTPLGVTREDNLKAIDKFLTKCNDYAQKYDVTVVIEPLNHNECDVINTVGEALEIAKRLNLSNIKVLADANHMFIEKEDFSILKKALPYLYHVHICEPNRRTCPGTDDGIYIKEMADELNRIGYNRTCTIECAFNDFVSEIKNGKIILKEILS